MDGGWLCAGLGAVLLPVGFLLGWLAARAPTRAELEQAEKDGESVREP